jgi:hypothetical protein
MTDKSSRPPSTQEMDGRIQDNLERLQGYIDVLLAEIDDPDKFGPGASDGEWKKEAQALKEELVKLQKFLESTEKAGTD